MLCTKDIKQPLSANTHTRMGLKHNMSNMIKQNSGKIQVKNLKTNKQKYKSFTINHKNGCNLTTDGLNNRCDTCMQSRE